MNLTNEGGYAGRFRYLKNIMGLWMIQSVRHEINDKYSFAEICAMAEEAKIFRPEWTPTTSASFLLIT